jgi:hypothetical protein
VVEAPVLPLYPDARGLVKKSVATLILVLFLGGGLVIGRDFLARSRPTPPDRYVEYLSLRKAAGADLRNLATLRWKRLRNSSSEGANELGGQADPRRASVALVIMPCGR